MDKKPEEMTKEEYLHYVFDDDGSDKMCEPPTPEEWDQSMKMLEEYEGRKAKKAAATAK